MSDITVKKPTEKELADLKVRAWPIWQKERSKFDWSYDEKETCYILKGEATITSKDGKRTDFRAGDLVVFPEGLRCVWEIHADVKKHYKFGA